MALNITPKKFGFKRDPPVLILYYIINESGKIHRRSIPVRGTETLSSADDLYNKLAREGNHMKYLETIPKKQVTKCLNMLLNKETENDKGNSKGNNEDLNKLNDDDLNAVKAKMNKSFEKNRIKPGDNDWKYDVEEDFETGVKIESGWDGDDQSDLEF